MCPLGGAVRKNLATAQARLDAARQAAATSPAKVSATDPDSRLLPAKNGGGWLQGWNLQLTAARRQVLLAAGASRGWRGLTMTADGLRLLHDLRRSLLEPPRELQPRNVTTRQPDDHPETVTLPGNSSIL